MTVGRVRILLVEDDARVATTLQRYLAREGFDVRVERDGESALQSMAANTTDLVLLDVMLPKVDGMDVCRGVRARSDIPIIMLTARTAIEDRIRGFEYGADDYISKPFSPKEVVARVRAVLRRVAARAPRELWSFGRLCIDRSSASATVGDKTVRLTRSEYLILEALVRADGRILSRSELVERAFGWDYAGNERTVDTHILNLRAKLGEAGRSIVTAFGSGYRFDAERLGA
jgi:DNA-binding response OmpR family regulator